MKLKGIDLVQFHPLKFRKNQKKFFKAIYIYICWIKFEANYIWKQLLLIYSYNNAQCEYEIVTSYLTKLEPNCMDTFFILLLLWKRQKKRLDLFWAVFLLIRTISAFVPHFYLLGFNDIFPPKGTTEGRSWKKYHQHVCNTVSSTSSKT